MGTFALKSWLQIKMIVIILQVKSIGKMTEIVNKSWQGRRLGIPFLDKVGVVAF